MQNDVDFEGSISKIEEKIKIKILTYKLGEKMSFEFHSCFAKCAKTWYIPNAKSMVNHWFFGVFTYALLGSTYNDVAPLLTSGVNLVLLFPTGKIQSSLNPKF